MCTLLSFSYYTFSVIGLAIDAEEISVNEGASKAQLTKAFKKHMGSKMTNKKILTNFITQIA